MTRQVAVDLGGQRLALLEDILAVMSAQTRLVGLDEVVVPVPAAARISRSADPADGGEVLTATWRNGRGERFGEVVFNGDGSFFAEYDVVCPHPRDRRWFVEAVTAWGRAGAVHAELRLLPAL